MAREPSSSKAGFAQYGVYLVLLEWNATISKTLGLDCFLGYSLAFKTAPLLSSDMHVKSNLMFNLF